LALGLVLLAAPARSQEKEFEISGYVQMQAGVFVPLASQVFKDYDNEAYIAIKKAGVNEYQYDQPCDPVNSPRIPCTVKNHGSKAGKLSMMRSSIDLMADWRPEEHVTIHAVVRLVGSLKLEVDAYAQPPSFPEGVDRRTHAIDYAWREHYNQADLREFYIDIETTDWLSFRVGRQQVVWGDINSMRLLDVVNPEDTTWHFGPLESFEDTRIPLWAVKTMFEMHDIDHSLELLWVPGIDRSEDTVNVPLTLVGAWGLPLTNTPSPYLIDEKVFLYPGNVIEDQRVGVRWRGNIVPESSYAFMYYYTHQMTPPIPLYYDQMPTEGGFFDPDHLKTLYLGFPRQHIAGMSLDYSFDNPIGMVAKLEASVEPNRTFPRQSTTRSTHLDTEYGSGLERVIFDVPTKPVLNYAVQLMRPTMIRWLNPTQNFLIVGQFSHSVVFNLSENDKIDLVQIPGYNNYKVAMHSFQGVFVFGTTYLHGLLSPRLTAAYIHPESGFIAGQLDLRLGRNWRLRFEITDFFGADPFKALGLFRDRDEINLRIRYQF